MKQSEPALTVFVSSRQDEATQWARDAANSAIAEIPIATPWLFEHTPASVEGPATSFMRKSVEADIMVLLIGETTSDPVIQESLSCIRSGGRLLAFLLPVTKRDDETQKWIGRIGENVKWCEVSRKEELSECIKSAIWDEVVRSVRGIDWPNRNRHLFNLVRRSIAECEFNWKWLGVEEEIARDLAEDEKVGSIEFELRGGEIQFLIGEQGSGKSLALHRIYQRRLRNAVSDAMAAFPVLIRFRGLTSSLLDRIASATDGFANPDTEPVLLLLDGLDEIETELAQKFLAETHSFISLHPASCAVITATRPPEPKGLGRIKRLTRLTEEQGFELLSRVCGRLIDQRDTFDWPASMRKAMHVPIFNVMIGSELARGDFSHVMRPVELVHRIMRRSSRASLESDVIADHLLQKLAIATVCAGRHVDFAELSVELADQVRIIGTRATVREGSKVDFSLPIVRDWYAARALIEGKVSLTELEQHKENWIIPIAVAIHYGDQNSVKSLMSELARTDAGFASRVMNAAGYHGFNDSQNDLPHGDAIALGVEIRCAMLDWSSSLGELMSDLSPTTTNGDLAPLGIRRGDRIGWEMITTAWYIGPGEVEKVFELPDSVHPASANSDWTNLQLSRIDPVCISPWIFAKQLLSQSLAKLVDSRLLGLDSSDGLHELAHEFCCHMLGEPWQRPHQANVAEVIRLLSKRDYEYIHLNQLGRVYGPDAIKKIADYLNHLLAVKGISSISSNLPGPDLNRPTGRQSWSWWELYSSENLVSRVSTIYGAAIRIYEEIASSRLIGLARWLPFYRAFPVSIEGRLKIPESAGDLSSKPLLQWWFRPLGPEEKSRVDFSISSTSLAEDTESQVVLESARVAAAEKGVGFTETATWLQFDEFIPAVELAHEWLSDDIAALGWNESEFGILRE